MSADEWVDHSDPCVYLSSALQPDLVLYTDIIAGRQESVTEGNVKLCRIDNMVRYRSISTDLGRERMA